MPTSPASGTSKEATMTNATFNAVTYPDTEGVYFSVARGDWSFAMFLNPEEIIQLKEVIENATR